VRSSLLIIDACRDNPLPKVAGRSIGSTRGLSAPEAGRGQAIIFSAGRGQQALDQLSEADKDPNGVFTRVFLREMRRPGVSVRRLLQDVRAEVDQLAKTVNHEQFPALYDEMRGDFTFFAGKPAVAQVASASPAASQQVVVSDDEVEREAWNVVKNSAQPETIKAFLSAFPSGRFATAAKLRLSILSEKLISPSEKNRKIGLLRTEKFLKIL